LVELAIPSIVVQAVDLPEVGVEEPIADEEPIDGREPGPV
jgi:hypothetical protein